MKKQKEILTMREYMTLERIKVEINVLIALIILTAIFMVSNKDTRVIYTESTVISEIEPNKELLKEYYEQGGEDGAELYRKIIIKSGAREIVDQYLYEMKEKDMSKDELERFLKEELKLTLKNEEMFYELMRR